MVYNTHHLLPRPFSSQYRLTSCLSARCTSYNLYDIIILRKWSVNVTTDTLELPIYCNISTYCWMPRSAAPREIVRAIKEFLQLPRHVWCRLYAISAVMQWSHKRAVCSCPYSVAAVNEVSRLYRTPWLAKRRLIKRQGEEREHFARLRAKL